MVRGGSMPAPNGVTGFSPGELKIEDFCLFRRGLAIGNSPKAALGGPVSMFSKPVGKLSRLSLCDSGWLHRSTWVSRVCDSGWLHRLTNPSKWFSLILFADNSRSFNFFSRSGSTRTKLRLISPGQDTTFPLNFP